jgi:hypothetical protein
MSTRRGVVLVAVSVATGLVGSGATLVNWSTVQAAPQIEAAVPDAKTERVLGALKAAIGGARVEAIKTLSAAGSMRQVFGDNDRTTGVEYFFLLPNHYQRIEQMVLPNGLPGPRMAQTINGDEQWFGLLTSSPAGMFVTRSGPQPGAERSGAAGGNRRSRMYGEFLRILLGMLPVPSALATTTFTYAGTARSQENAEAEVLDVQARGFEGKLFIDKRTHLALMLTFQAPDMNATIGRLPQFRRKQGESQEDARKRIEAEGQGPWPTGPPAIVEHQVYFAEPKKVDGISLPTRFTRAVNGKTVEEIEITKYTINPKIDGAQFQRKGN